MPRSKKTVEEEKAQPSASAKRATKTARATTPAAETSRKDREEPQALPAGRPEAAADAGGRTFPTISNSAAQEIAELREKSGKLEELVVGLVGAVGTDLKTVSEILEELAGEYNYTPQTLRLSEILGRNPRWSLIPEKTLDQRYEKYMNAGDEVREEMDSGKAMAVMAMAEILVLRDQLYPESSKIMYILRSLKHPDEIRALKQVYGNNFVSISVYSQRDERVSGLAKAIAKSHVEASAEAFRQTAEDLVYRDETGKGNKLGQNVRDTFPMADFFVTSGEREEMKTAIGRFLDLVFGHPFHTPTRDEYAMFMAQASSLRSASLARQVGAVITDKEGNIVSLGTNDVPTANGGLYWSGDKPDHRDFCKGVESNDEIKYELVADFLKRLGEAKWLDKSKLSVDVEELVRDAIFGKDSAFLKKARLMNVIEFTRCVHAEMAAIVDAARRGASIKDCILFTTTFPCHECARHIVAAGFKRVVFIAPYPKSLALDLHGDAISLDRPSSSPFKILFEPFVGISPNQYLHLFAADERKAKDGRAINWSRFKSKRRSKTDLMAYFHVEGDETLALKAIAAWLSQPKPLNKIVKRKRIRRTVP